MSNNILLSSPYPCSGCGACSAVCPKNAIRLKLDDAGFYKAFVDAAVCVDCGLCTKVCTRYEEEFRGISLYDAPLYALQSADAGTVRRCTSGGIAHELSAHYWKQGYKVIGVVYNTDTDRAEHIIACEEGQLAAFDGSKYIQSNPEKAFAQAVLEAGSNADAKFLVFGTPCQIAGLDKVTRRLRIRDQFLLAEIFCHGVPSYKLWDDQCGRIRKKLKTEKFDSVQFRYKKDDWHSYCLRVDAGEKTFFGARETELFWQVFFENILLGDSCYSCRLRKEISMADLRLGDYWGKAFAGRSDGVSAVFACTARGEKAIRELEEAKKVCRLEATDAKTMLAAQNMEGYHQQALHDKAMQVLREQGIRPAVKTYRAGQTSRQKLKRLLLTASAIIPDAMRAKLRKMNSSHRLSHSEKK